MKTNSLLLAAALLAGYRGPAVAQPQTAALPAIARALPAPRTGTLRLQGQVLGPDSSAAPGVTISLAATPLATTDEQGNFDFTVPDAVMEKLPDAWVAIDFTYFSLWQQTVRLGQKAPPNRCSLRVWITMTPYKTVVKEDYRYPPRGPLPRLPAGYPVDGPGQPGTRITESAIANGSQQLPVMPNFPTRPPSPSTPEQLLPVGFLAGATTLGAADARLSAALDRAGYNGRTRYYAYPNGYARTTLIEGIDGEGRPLPLRPQRWPSDRPPKMNWHEWLKNLVVATPGHFRVLVFIVSTADVASSGTTVTAEAARDWVRVGPGILPSFLGSMPYSSGHHCTVWVYEFQKDPGPGQRTQPVTSSYVTLEHLTKSGIMPEH